MKKVMIGDELSRGWKLYKAHLGVLMGATLVATLLGSLVCGIFMGPMMAGLFILIGGLLENDPARSSFGTIFKGFEKFGPCFVTWLVMAIVIWALSALAMVIPVIGALVSIAISLLGGTATYLALLFVSRKGMTGMEAVKEVLRGSFNGTYLNFLLAGFVFLLVGISGTLVCGLGVIFTVPIYYCALFCAYKSVFEDAAPAPSAEPAPAPTPAA